MAHAQLADLVIVIVGAQNDDSSFYYHSMVINPTRLMVSAHLPFWAAAPLASQIGTLIRPSFPCQFQGHPNIYKIKTINKDDRFDKYI